MKLHCQECGKTFVLNLKKNPFGECTSCGSGDCEPSTPILDLWAQQHRIEDFEPTALRDDERMIVDHEQLIAGGFTWLSEES